MITLDEAAMTIGYVAMIASGAAVVTGGFTLVAYFLNKAGWNAWDRARSLYKVEVMSYWFRRMDKDGTHIIRKEYEDKKGGEP